MNTGSCMNALNCAHMMRPASGIRVAAKSPIQPPQKPEMEMLRLKTATSTAASLCVKPISSSHMVRNTRAVCGGSSKEGSVLENG